MKKITCIGDIGIDKYLDKNIITPGGCSFNVAFHLKKTSDKYQYNHSVSIISALGSDCYAKDLARLMKFNNIINNCHQKNGVTPIQEIKILEDGEKHFVKWHKGVLDNYKLSNDDFLMLGDSDYIITLCYKELIYLFESIIKYTNALLVCDFMDFKDISIKKLNEYIKDIDILFFGLNSDEIDLIDKLKNLAIKYQKLIIITLGKDGVVIFNRDEVFWFDANPVQKVIDTTGAGDTFLGTFMGQYISGKSITDSAKQALKSAAETVSWIGATDQHID